MTTDVVDDRDDDTWWDRHGWDGPAAPGAADDRGGLDAEPGSDGPGSGGGSPGQVSDGPPWSRVLSVVAATGTLLTLPLAGFAGGYGRIAAPAVWALVGLAASLLLSRREPDWDLGEPRRAEPVVGWAVAYLLVLVVGLDVGPLAGSPGYWLPLTPAVAAVPWVLARLRNPVRAPRAEPGAS